MTIYIASKTKHAARWRDLRRNHGFQIISTWIDEAGPGESPNRPDLACRCIAEASHADKFILYCETGEMLKGALVEMGAALSAGRPVFTVGECANWPAGSAFVDHPLVERFDDAVTAMYANPIRVGAGRGAGVNAFNKLISTLPILTTDEEVLGRLLWNAAMEEAAKAVENLSPVTADAMTVAMAARAIRAMQTTAVAAATPAPAAERGPP